jgi:lipid II isoglutaminyl synthase (glutamine-hydrolysing)
VTPQLPGAAARFPARARAMFAMFAGRMVGALYESVDARGRSTIVGRVALRLCPLLLQIRARTLTTVLVSGTNGKTTSTRFIAEALAAKGAVATNGTGANMLAGIASALAQESGAELSALEVDERHLPMMLDALRPSVTVLLNLTRDQLDRTPECRYLSDLWRSALTGAEGVVVANADDPLVVWAAGAARRVVWVALGSAWTDDSRCCPACARRIAREHDSWWCDCGLRRPVPDWRLDGERVEDRRSGRQYELALHLPGRVNRSNATVALAAAAIVGVPPAEALPRINDVRSIAGRYASGSYQGKRLRLLLAKNPASWLETMSLLKPITPVLLVLNARVLDGIDTSWLWDVEFDRLSGRQLFVMGERRYDLAVRLSRAGIPFSMVETLDGACRSVDHAAIEIVANYTAFLELVTMSKTVPDVVWSTEQRTRRGSAGHD